MNSQIIIFLKVPGGGGEIMVSLLMQSCSYHKEAKRLPKNLFSLTQVLEVQKLMDSCQFHLPKILVINWWLYYLLHYINDLWTTTACQQQPLFWGIKGGRCTQADLLFWVFLVDATLEIQLQCPPLNRITFGKH